MKKVIIKTALLTLTAIMALALIVYGVFALFFPSNLANFYRGVYNYDVALKYSERAYRKSGNAEDCLTVVYDAINAENSEKIAKYAPKILAFSDLNSQDRCEIGGKYCVLLYNKGNRNANADTDNLKTDNYKKAVEVAQENTFRSKKVYATGYVKPCPMRALIFAALDDCNAVFSADGQISQAKLDFLKDILSELSKESENATMLTETEKTMLSADISVLQTFINRAQES